MTTGYGKLATSIPYAEKKKKIRPEGSLAFFINNPYEHQRAILISSQLLTPQVSVSTKFGITKSYCFNMGGGSASCHRPSRPRTQAPQKRSVKVFSSFVCLSYLYKIKKSGPELPESNPRFTQPGAYLLYMPPSQQTSDTQCHRPKRSVLRRACPKIENSPTGRRKAGLLARSCRYAFPAGASG